MPEKQNNPRPTMNSRPPTKNASRTSFANPSDFGKNDTPMRTRMQRDLMKKQNAATKPPAKGR